MRRVGSAFFLVLLGTHGTSARAEEAPRPSFFDKSMAAPVGAFELNFATAYNQGWGNLTDSVSPTARTLGRQVQDFAGAGIVFELDLGYRASPMFAAGVYGTVGGYTNQTVLSGADTRSLTAGVQGQWFMRPFRAFSPWITLGSGYRGSWFVPEVGGITARHGWELARLQIGADFRVSTEVAVAPYVAGDVNLVFSETLPNGDARNLHGPPAFASFTAGVLGRFDFGHKYVTERGVVLSRR
jgi:hypothetical protein